MMIYVKICKLYLNEAVKKVGAGSAQTGPRKKSWLHIQNMLPYLQCYPLTTVCSTGTTCLTIKVTLYLFISPRGLEHSELYWKVFFYFLFF